MPPSGIAWYAFVTRFVRTSANWPRSPMRSIDPTSTTTLTLSGFGVAVNTSWKRSRRRISDIFISLGRTNAVRSSASMAAFDVSRSATERYFSVIG